MSTIKIAGKDVGPIGLGLIPFMTPGRDMDNERSFDTLKAALAHGANFWDAGEFYGSPERNSLHFMNEYFTKYPEDADKVFLSVKGAFDFAGKKATNDAEGVKKSIENCLRILDGKKKIDLFQAARGDRGVPIEETVSAIAEYVKAGKIGSVGLSECGAETVKRASAVHPIAAVEVELSLFSTQILADGGTAKACAECKVPIIAYSPLGRGFLSGTIKSLDDLPANDFRRHFPRFQPENFDQNLKLVNEVEQIAKKKGCSTAQVALAWVSSQGKELGIPVMPIPGSANPQRLKENVTSIELSQAELQEINEVLARIEVKGARYPGAFNDMLEI